MDTRLVLPTLRRNRLQRGAARACIFPLRCATAGKSVGGTRVRAPTEDSADLRSVEVAAGSAVSFICSSVRGNLFWRVNAA